MFWLERKPFISGSRRRREACQLSRSRQSVAALLPVGVYLHLMAHLMVFGSERRRDGEESGCGDCDSEDGSFHGSVT
jgi:hypothetical protein